MKLERLHESVLPSVVVVSGLILATYAGLSAGSGKAGTVAAIVGGIFAIATLLVIRERVWMLIPTLWLLGGQISVLPLPFSVRQLGVLFALGSILLLKAFKVVRLKPKIGVLDIWLAIVFVYLGTVFLRNPVGVDALGSEKVGGKPYFDAFIGFAAYWVLSRSVANPRQGLMLPFLMFGVTFIETALNFIARWFPSLAYPLTQVYSGISALETGEVQVQAAGEPLNRQAYLMGLGVYGTLISMCFWRPFSLLNPLNFFRWLIFTVCAYAILLSGFRSALGGMIAAFLISSYFQRGIIEVFRAAMIGLPIIGLLILLQGTMLELPMPAQRALSFLPGKWSYEAKQQAEDSTEWRVTMWKQMLSDDKYIANKWLGDGFGFTKHQLFMMNANLQSMDTATQQENLLISGGVHSGPISAIRYVGYIGLSLFMIMIIIVAVRAAQLIRRSENTPYYFLALFLCVPAVWFPINFVFIFGSYADDLPGITLTIGLLKLLENSLNAYETKQKEASAPMIAPPKFRRAPSLASASRIG